MGAMFQMPPGFFNQRDFRADEQNAMLRQQALEQGTIRTTEMQEAQRKRQDLEGVLRASQNPEKDALLWAQRNDFDMHTKLSQLYFQKLVGEAQIDPDQAVANFTRRTGEPMQFVGGAKDWLSFQNNGQTTLFNLRSGDVKTFGEAKPELHNVPANTDVINKAGELIYQSERPPTPTNLSDVEGYAEYKKQEWERTHPGQQATPGQMAEWMAEGRKIGPSMVTGATGASTFTGYDEQ